MKTRFSCKRFRTPQTTFLPWKSRAFFFFFFSRKKELESHSPKSPTIFKNQSFWCNTHFSSLKTRLQHPLLCIPSNPGLLVTNPLPFLSFLAEEWLEGKPPSTTFCNIGKIYFPFCLKGKSSTFNQGALINAKESLITPAFWHTQPSLLQKASASFPFKQPNALGTQAPGSWSWRNFY